jgi:hypothetical protein
MERGEMGAGRRRMSYVSKFPGVEFTLLHSASVLWLSSHLGLVLSGSMQPAISVNRNLRGRGWCRRIHAERDTHTRELHRYAQVITTSCDQPWKIFSLDLRRLVLNKLAILTDDEHTHRSKTVDGGSRPVGSHQEFGLPALRSSRPNDQAVRGSEGK